MDALKKALRNNKIEVENNELLMPKPGKPGCFFKCYSDLEGAIEIIVPNEMAEYIAIAAYKQCIIRNYQGINCTEINQ